MSVAIRAEREDNHARLVLTGSFDLAQAHRGDDGGGRRSIHSSRVYVNRCRSGATRFA